MRLRLLPLVALLILPPVFTGCAAGPGSGSPGSNRNLITSEEIREIETGTPTLDVVIRRLRPTWLRSRARTINGGNVMPVVYLDGARFGDLETLTSLQAQDVQEVRFMSASDATTRYGTGHAGGVIAVRSRRGGG